jgi:hypothetical protein
MEGVVRHTFMGKWRRAGARRLEGALSGIREQGRGKRERKGGGGNGAHGGAMVQSSSA